MERGPANSALRQIRTLFTLGTLGDLTDAQLLELFLTRQREAAEDAFAILVNRHGPTVLGVCRRMLSGSHDAEDAFQATFLILARKAASLGPRVRLAGWLHGVAVRTAREARRRAARQRAKEKRLMDVTEAESAPAENHVDLLPILDEELNRLPPRYRAALVACELEGKSRHDAAQQLGLPEGTLSTHLARGRKLLRERLLRRGVSLGAGPIAGLARDAGVALVPEHLLGSTVKVALVYLPQSGIAGTVPAAVASLAERVLKMMLLTRLSLIVAAVTTAGAALVSAVVLGSIAPAEGPPPKPVAAQPGANDVPGRVVDKAGSSVAGAQVWAIGGSWDEPETAAVATTDGQGRFILRGPLNNNKVAEGRGRFELFARAPDGRAGWAGSLLRNSADGKQIDVELHPASEARGRVIDQDGHPIAGAAMMTFQFSMGGPRTTDYVNLSPEAAALYQTKTGPDGSFVLAGVPRGAGMQATIIAKAFGSPRIVWDTAQAVSISLDNRLGRIRGRLKLPDSRGLAHPPALGLHSAARTENSASPPFEVFCFRNAVAANDGAFQFDDLPPGRYVVNAYFDQDGIIAVKPQTEIEVGPGAIAQLEIPLLRVPMITGRVVDTRTGKGVGGIKLQSLLLDALRNTNLVVSETTTDADGTYTIAARPGKILIESTEVPKAFLSPTYVDYPRLEVKADRTWPDLKFTPAVGLDGIVVGESGHPAAGAEVYLLAADRPKIRREEPVRAGADGAFHFDQLDPQEPLSLWARSGDATTDGAVTVRPSEVNGKLTLTIDPKFAVRIRGMATDPKGKRIASAKATLRWVRPYASGKGGWVGSVLESYATTENGWFVFRGLWPRLEYKIVVKARGHNKAEAPK